MRTMIVVTARAHVPAEHRARFVEVATEMCTRSRDDDGCGGYRVYEDLEQPERYAFVEEWADEDALQRHFAQSHTRAFMRDLAGLLAGPADIVFHTTSSARRLDPQRGLVAVEDASS
jgi:quinol monooxygenase YgiN